MFHDLPGFFFAGASTVPGVLLFADPALGLLAFVVLMLAGCFSGMCDPQAPFRAAGENRESRPD